MFTHTRLGAVAFAVAGILFILYPAVRPWRDESTAEGAIAAMSSGAWVAAHLFAMLGFILVGLGLLALRDALSGTRGQQVALAAVVTWWIGAGLTLPYYGAEDFGLNAIARKAAGQQVNVLDLVQTVRFSPVPVTVFLLGLLGLGVAAILAAVAIWRSRSLPRYSGVVFALGFALFIPQFYGPPVVRIAHGVLVGIGCFWVAVALWTAKPSLTAIKHVGGRRVHLPGADAARR